MHNVVQVTHGAQIYSSFKEIISCYNYTEDSGGLMCILRGCIILLSSSPVGSADGRDPIESTKVHPDYRILEWPGLKRTTMLT